MVEAVSNYRHLNDEQLERAAADMRERAHSAPKRISGTQAAPFISNDDSCFRFAAEWARMAAEIKRRRATNPSSE